MSNEEFCIAAYFDEVEEEMEGEIDKNDIMVYTLPT